MKNYRSKIRHPLVAVALTMLVLAGMSSTAKAQFFQNTTGLASPGTTLTFEEIILTPFGPPHNNAGNDPLLTSQYAAYGVNFTGFYYFNDNDDTTFNTQYPLIYSYDPAGPNPPNNNLSILFSSPVSQAALAVGSIDSPEDTTFGAYLGGVLQSSGTFPTSLGNPDNYYGFTGIVFDELRITTFSGVLQADNLQFTVVPKAVFLQNTTGLTNPGTTLTFEEIILSPFGGPHGSAGDDPLLTSQYAAYGVNFTGFYYFNDNDDTTFNTQYPLIYGYDPAGPNPPNNNLSILFSSPVSQAALAVGSIDSPEDTTFGAYLGGVLQSSGTFPTSLGNPDNYYGFTGGVFDELRITTSSGILQADNLQFTFAPFPPTLVSASRSLCDETLVMVVFSKSLDGATATNASNYAIDSGVTVSAATLASSNTVVLTTSPPITAEPALLTVNGIEDTSGNRIATNSQIAIAVPIPAPNSSVINLTGSIQVSNRVSQFTLTGKARQWYQIEASTNFANWLSLGRIYNTNGVSSFKDVAATNFPKRFYRAKLVAPAPSFSFTYGGLSSTQLLSGWTSNQTEVVLDAQRKQRTVVYNDPVTGLEVTCQAIEYADFPAVEWVLYFKNNGLVDTPILEQVNAADFTIRRGSSGELTLYYADGSTSIITDFQPRQTQLLPDSTRSFTPFGGRSSDSVSPYFNVAQPDGGGDMVAIGWSGQWAASFTRNSTTNLSVKAGMQLTRLKLHPGERIRTPSILQLQYAGNRLNGHNLFRNLLRKHYSPTPGGQPVVTPIAASPHGYIAFEGSTEANMLQAINNIAFNDFPVDTYWIDAGWYPSPNNNWAEGVGNWFPDPARYPNGLKPVADAAHNNGMKFLLWFEPERVMPNTWLRTNHANWLLAPSNLPAEVAYQTDWRLLNFGNSAALTWAKSNFSGMISNVGIDIYRHDFNMHPLYYWRSGEALDRQGITEIFYIMGLYAYFDTLLTDHPSLIIDNVASGGRRLDFEMARRSVPLIRTDYLWDPIGAQCMEHAVSFWLPLHGQGAVLTDPYNFRSGMGYSAVYAFNFFGDSNNPSWVPAAQQIMQYKLVKNYFLGDFYPLTPYSISNTKWLAYQFDRPDLNGGMMQAFRRDASSVSSMFIRLSGLDLNARYAITNLDVPGVSYLYGCDLMGQGLPVSISAQPGAAIFTYQKTP